MKEWFPTILSSRSVLDTFKACVADQDSQEVIPCVLFQKSNGFPSDSRPIYFDKELLEKRVSKLEYMLGQLKDVHNKQTQTNTNSIKVKYDNTVWATDNQSLLIFLHMCLAAKLISPIMQKDSSIKFLTTLYPTITPGDPAFFDWLDENEPKILKLIAEENGQKPVDG